MKDRVAKHLWHRDGHGNRRVQTTIRGPGSWVSTLGTSASRIPTLRNPSQSSTVLVSPSHRLTFSCRVEFRTAPGPVGALLATRVGAIESSGRSKMAEALTREKFGTESTFDDGLVPSDCGSAGTLTGRSSWSMARVRACDSVLASSLLGEAVPLIAISWEGWELWRLEMEAQRECREEPRLGTGGRSIIFQEAFQHESNGCLFEMRRAGAPIVLVC
jgi:hypothetical protein